MSLLIASEDHKLTTPVNQGGGVTDQARAIQLEGVSVTYRAPQERIGSFKEYAIRLLQGRVQHAQFHALREVSLTVKQGEVFGVIGHNGAGKSTLLKVISRIMQPSAGRVVVRGRLAPLLELGAGFHPELTGRENIFLNGTLLGNSQAQMEALFDDIVEFAELRDFVDAPLRTYSTGMAVRLGFAVATAVRPDVLLVDEVLSVGDERFQMKCLARMNEFRQHGTTIVLVTHNTRLVLNLCDRAVWLNHGQVGALGEVNEAVAAYQRKNVQESATQRARAQTVKQSSTSATLATGSAEPKTITEPTPLEQTALEKQWLYRYELPCGLTTECLLPPQIAVLHDSRWQMLQAALAPLCDGQWDKLTCLDLGCGQGYFAVKLAQLGCSTVVGVDARRANLQDAELMQRIYGLNNLQFRQADLLELTPQESCSSACSINWKTRWARCV
jgi:ABC-type polysaccharide/polyol phosphate transport system ATPase subunit